jgi:hypothetical protein
MITDIYCFSGTGNSLHVAKELQRRIPGTSLVPVASLLDKESIETRAETVGLVFPQYERSSHCRSYRRRGCKRKGVLDSRVVVSILKSL